LGLDDELEDVPTAELDLACYDESTVGVDGDAPPIATTFEPRQAPFREAQRRAEVSGGRAELRADVSPQSPSPSGVPMESPATRDTPDVAVPAPGPRELSTGSLLCNRYLLGRLLGTGGSSLVYQAEDRQRIGAEDFGSRIAIKVLRLEARHNVHALTRLRREFRQMQRLQHPGIARVFDLGRDDDIWFMTMELVDGETINQWLSSTTTRADALRIIGACSEALAHAHAAGVVHGDLKPSNVLVLPQGGVRLVDFGSAAERDTTTGAVDKERSFAATPPYASPQVLAGMVADPRDDVFSLACLSYAVLTRGEHPFDRKSSAEAQQAKLRPSYSRALHPREFDAIVRGLAWEREQRPASVREFLDLLLASDLRRDTNTLTVEVPKPTPSVAIPDVAPVAAKIDPVRALPEPTAQLRDVPVEPAATPIQASSVRQEDIARLNAALAAAEEHAQRAEQSAEAKQGTTAADDALARFRGYVAGPMAGQEASVDIAPAALQSERSPGAQKKAKRVWPWSVLMLALAVIGIGVLVATQFDLDAEPIQRAGARAVAPIVVPPIEAVITPLPPPVEPAAIEEKKSAPAVRAAATLPPAPGEVSFATRTLQVGAGQTLAALSVKRVNSTRGRARVAWTIEGGTARKGVDYQLDGEPVIQFLEGQSVRSLFIPLVAERDPRSARTSRSFTVKLQQAAGGPALGEIKQVHVTIVGDVDEPPAQSAALMTLEEADAD